MSRHVSIRELQNAIGDLRAWQHDDCPDWARGLVQEVANLLEAILCSREEKP